VLPFWHLEFLMAKKPAPVVEPVTLPPVEEITLPPVVAEEPKEEPTEPPPSLAEQIAAHPWAGNEKCVPTALLVSQSDDDLEVLGYVRVRVGLGGTVLRAF
jgi:hypothetical protein